MLFRSHHTADTICAADATRHRAVFNGAPAISNHAASTAKHVIACYLYAKKSFTAKQRHEIITGLLKSVGLESKENDYPINLSGGEQQRVAIARALAVSPEAILCDEPTGALDKKTGTQIMELLHSVVKENGIMLLLVTHDPDIADTCDTIFEMDGGRITCAKNDT